ncbi:competence protein ComG [Priestia megaterium]|nr:competence protein ComG [Priestia megaterium]
MNNQMMKNERGFVLPLVLAFSALFLFLLSQQIAYYVTKSNFYHEAEERYQLDHLLENAVLHLQSHVRKEGSFEEELSLSFPSGTILYKVVEQSDGVIVVNITCQTQRGSKLTNTAHVQLNDGQVIQWID